MREPSNTSILLVAHFLKMSKNISTGLRPLPPAPHLQAEDWGIGHRKFDDLQILGWCLEAFCTTELPKCGFWRSFGGPRSYEGSCFGHWCLVLPGFEWSGGVLGCCWSLSGATLGVSGWLLEPLGWLLRGLGHPRIAKNASRMHFGCHMKTCKNLCVFDGFKAWGAPGWHRNGS